VHYDIEVLLNEILELFDKEDREAVSLLFNWLKFLYKNKRISQDDYEQLNQLHYDKGAVSMLIESIRKEHERAEKQRAFFEQQRQWLEEKHQWFEQESQRIEQEQQLVEQKQLRIEQEQQLVEQKKLRVEQESQQLNQLLEQRKLDVIKEGIKEGKRETARSMLLKGFDIDLIMSITELSQAEIEELKS
jgi:hypothetical protein